MFSNQCQLSNLQIWGFSIQEWLLFLTHCFKLRTWWDPTQRLGITPISVWVLLPPNSETHIFWIIRVHWHRLAPLDSIGLLKFNMRSCRFFRYISYWCQSRYVPVMWHAFSDPKFKLWSMWSVISGGSVLFFREPFGTWTYWKKVIEPVIVRFQALEKARLHTYGYLYKMVKRKKGTLASGKLCDEFLNGIGHAILVLVPGPYEHDHDTISTEWWIHTWFRQGFFRPCLVGKSADPDNSGRKINLIMVSWQIPITFSR